MILLICREHDPKPFLTPYTHGFCSFIELIYFHIIVTKVYIYIFDTLKDTKTLDFYP